MKQQLKNLWKETFGDEDIFLDLFFTHVYKEENVLFYEKQGKIISALHMIPYEMTLNNEIIPVSYICGVATIPEERGKGLMSSLMQEAHNILQKRGHQLAVLIPASSGLFDYYRTMGYYNLFYYQETTFTSDSTNYDFSEYRLLPSSSLPSSLLFVFFNQMQKKRDIGILHSYDDFKTIIKDLKNGEGELFSLLNTNGKIIAQAFMVPQSGNLLIKDLFYLHPTHKSILLTSIGKAMQNQNITVREPVGNGNPVAFGMAYNLNGKIDLSKEKSYGFMSLMLE